MGKFVDYFKFVSPNQETSVVQDSQGMDGQYATYGNYTWYQRLVQGSATRLTRYREYDIMDNDIEITRALDTIAEEMTTKNAATNLPLDVEIETEEGLLVEDTLVMTIRAALRHWSGIHNWKTRLFKISRNTIKYGDCFFRKRSPHTPWEWIPAANVLAAYVDADDVTKVKGFVIRTDTKRPRTAGGAPGDGTPGMNTVSVGEPYETEYVTMQDIVRFSLNDDMSESAPFGDSVLRSVYRSHKQKELLEDAIIIYRIVRAPERRVFYMDVGKMPPHRVKQYLETVKNEIRQKKIPSQMGGKESVDSVYNPQSMTEDFFFASHPDGRGSKVETLPGGQGLGELTDLDYFVDKVLRGLRVPKSWMKPGAEGGIFNDGKVGAAYIEELQFARYVERLQSPIENVIDKEFKLYLRNCNINIDESTYRIRIPTPNNYEQHRRADLDSNLINNMASAESIPYLSKRFALSRYLQLTDDEIVQNEMLLRQEKKVKQSPDGSDIALLYGSEEIGLDGGMRGGFGGGVGGDFGGGVDGDFGGGVGGEEQLPPGEGGLDLGGGIPPVGGQQPPNQGVGTQPPPGGTKQPAI
jgi:hypothetical protein